LFEIMHLPTACQRALLIPLVLGITILPANAEGIYRVKLGDTLSGIARKNSVSLTKLIAANPQIADPDLIQVGQRLTVPGDVVDPQSITKKPVQPIKTGRKKKRQKIVAVVKKPVETVVKPIASGEKPVAPILKPLTPKIQAPSNYRPAFLSLKLPTQQLVGNRQGAAKRGPGCSTPRKSLAALLPDTNLGLVVAEQPTFFWFMPNVETPEPAEIEFVLSATDGNGLDIDPPLYNTRFSSKGLSGISNLTVPADRPSLEVGRDYRWSLSIICNPEDRSQDEEVSGWIRRIAPDPALATKLEKAGPTEYPAIYAEAGLWFDALRYLAALRRQSNNDTTLTSDWSSLLKAVGLVQVSDKPLTCVAPSTESTVQCPVAPKP
jgi:LysM repeat protein